MYYRNSLKYLKEWSLKSSRKPLILRGARQVGKTTLINQFSKEFDQYIYLNLEEQLDKAIFENQDGFDSLLSAIFFIKDKEKTNKRILIFIDEIQNSTEAVKYLRYFYEKAPEIFVIAAGSLLESLIDKKISFPVGRVEYAVLHPFSFDEFLLATSNKKAFDLLKTIPAPDYAHAKLLSLFNTYTLIGGMPEVVKSYVENNDIVKLGNIYEALIVSYLDDVEKYANSEKDTRILRFVIRNAFIEAGNRIKFTQFANSKYRAEDISEAFTILEKTHLLKLIYPTTNVQLPIQANNRKSPKLQLLDTGLVNYFSGANKEAFLSDNLMNVYKGKIVEHIVAQELRQVFNSQLHNIHFWVREKKQSNAEVDFVIPYEDKLIPIEVKSGSSGRLRSLHQFIDKAPHNFAVRLYAGEIRLEKSTTISGKEFFLLNLPYYLTSRILKYISYFFNNEA